MSRTLLRCLALIVTLQVAAGAEVVTDGAGGATRKEPSGGFLDRVYTDETGDHRYVVFVPETPPPSEGWPVILFLHGAGERGVDGRRQLDVGLGPIVKLQQQSFPAVVVFPQCEDTTGPILSAWDADGADGRRALKILELVERDFPVNPQLRALTGWSMGGYGAWSLARAFPEMWTAVLPVSGGGDVFQAERLRKVPLWAVHGADDAVVPAEESRRMVEAVRAAGGQPQYTEIHAGRHDVWASVYLHPVVQSWLFAPGEVTADPDSLRFDLKAGDAIVDLQRRGEFVPAMTIKRALSIRVGNPTLQGLSQGIHTAIDPAALRGTIADIEDHVELGDQQLEIALQDLSYDAELARVRLRSLGSDRLSLVLELRALRLRIGETHVAATGFSGMAGPVDVVIGHRMPVPLSLEIRPKVEAGRLMLELLRSSLRIPDNNWYVSAPESLSVDGTLLSQDHLRVAVMGGLYLRRSQIEQEVLSAVPGMLRGLEGRLKFDGISNLATTLWPIPVYRPEMRVLVDGVSCDRQGISATFSLQVAGVEGEVPSAGVVSIRVPGPDASHLPHTDDIRVTVSSQVMEQVSRLFADSGKARIHAADVPGRPFDRLVDRATLKAALPGLSAVGAGDLRTELLLVEPFSVQPVANPRGDQADQVELRLNVPKLRLQVSIPALASASVVDKAAAPSRPETQGSREWNPFAEIDYHIVQPAEIHIVKQHDDEPGLAFVWGMDPELTCTARLLSPEHGAGGTFDISLLTEKFQESWVGWTTSRAPGGERLRDLVLGRTRMVPSSVAWSGTNLGATFAPPVTRLTNETSRPIEYAVRGPFSNWSELRELPPEQEHTYRVPYPLTVRLPDEPGQAVRTLSVGSHAKVQAGPRGAPVIAPSESGQTGARSTAGVEMPFADR